MLDEADEFVRPNPDLRPVSRRTPGVWSYGVLPREVCREAEDRLRAVLRRRAARAGWGA